MKALQRVIRFAFQWLELGLDRIFGPNWNPVYHLGALGFFFYWIVAVSGIYIYILFDTGTTEAYESVEFMTHGQWYLGGVMRSLHRYASDAMVAVMALHIVREFSLDRYRGSRWFTWVTGMPILWLVMISGITGYWLIWDRLAQYIAVASAEILDWLPIFGEPIARNFLHADSLDDRFFTLLIFLHIALPLILLLVLWIHLQRVSRAEINPPRGLMAGTFVMLMVLSFWKPALSQGPADLAAVPTVVGLDWFYVGFYPLIDLWPHGLVWALAGGMSLLLVAIPWLPPRRRPPVAEVDLAHCNGCKRCAADCPYSAVIMAPRTDDRPFKLEASVNPALCTSCGICVGACPSSSPFRRIADLATGIDLPSLPLRDLHTRMEEAGARAKGEARILVFGCDHGVDVSRLEGLGVGAVSMPCIAMLPPSFIDYALSRGLAEGVIVTGCAQGECYNRFGVRWTEERFAHQRDPYLRRRVPRDRVATVWAAPIERVRLEREIAAFGARLKTLTIDEAKTVADAAAAVGPTDDAREGSDRA